MGQGHFLLLHPPPHCALSPAVAYALAGIASPPGDPCDGDGTFGLGEEMHALCPSQAHR